MPIYHGKAMKDTALVPTVEPDDERKQLIAGIDTLVERARAVARHGKITTKTQAEEAGIILRMARSRRRNIEAHYKKIRSAAKKLVDSYKLMEHDDSAPCVEIDTLLADLLQAYLLEQQTLANEANKAAIAEAEARAKAERDEQVELLRVAAAVAPTARARKELESQARAAERAPVLPVLTAAVEAPTIKGISIQKRKVADVVDLLALVRAVANGEVPIQAIKPDQSWLDDQATARGSLLNFPGVVVRTNPSLTARGV